MTSPLVFRLLDTPLAICRLDAAAAIPSYADTPPFSAVVRTRDELSVVCAESALPPGLPREGGRRAFGIDGVVPMTTVGLLAALLGPLADAGISVFVVSTFDTDWILVREEAVVRTAAVLRGLGHRVVDAP